MIAYLLCTPETGKRPPAPRSGARGPRPSSKKRACPACARGALSPPRHALPARRCASSQLAAGHGRGHAIIRTKSFRGLRFRMKLRIVLAALTAAVAAACGSTTSRQPASFVDSAPTSERPTAPRARAAIGEFGLDLTARKAEVEPGDDFFTYANGTWYEKFTIPEDRSTYGIFSELDERSQERVRAIIEEAASTNPAFGTPEQKIGDFYASFMDEAAIERKGLDPAKPDLERIAAAKTKRDIAALFGTVGFVSTFNLSMPPDLKNPRVYA